MELLLLIGGLLLLDLLAMRFGVDSRALNLREDRGWWPDVLTGDPHRDFARSHQIQLHYEAEVERIASLAGAGQSHFRLRRLPRLTTRRADHSRRILTSTHAATLHHQVTPAE